MDLKESKRLGNLPEDEAYGTKQMKRIYISIPIDLTLSLSQNISQRVKPFISVFRAGPFYISLLICA